MPGPTYKKGKGTIKKGSGRHLGSGGSSGGSSSPAPSTSTPSSGADVYLAKKSTSGGSKRGSATTYPTYTPRTYTPKPSTISSTPSKYAGVRGASTQYTKVRAKQRKNATRYAVDAEIQDFATLDQSLKTGSAKVRSLATSEKAKERMREIEKSLEGKGEAVKRRRRALMANPVVKEANHQGKVLNKKGLTQAERRVERRRISKALGEGKELTYKGDIGKIAKAVAAKEKQQMFEETGLHTIGEKEGALIHAQLGDQTKPLNIAKNVGIVGATVFGPGKLWKGYKALRSSALLRAAATGAKGRNAALTEAAVLAGEKAAATAARLGAPGKIAASGLGQAAKAGSKVPGTGFVARRPLTAAFGGVVGVGTAQDIETVAPAAAGLVTDLATGKKSLNNIVEGAAKAVVAAPEGIAHSFANIGTNSEVRATTVSTFPQLALQAVAFPLLLGKNLIQEGVVGAAEDPANKAVLEEIVHRWELAQDGEWNEFEKLQEEQGALPFLLEAAGVTSIASRGVGAPVRATVGEKAWARPDLRIDLGGEARPQLTSKGIIGRTGQLLIDTNRRIVQQSRLSREARFKKNQAQALWGAKQPPKPTIRTRGPNEVVPASRKLRNRMTRRNAANIRAEGDTVTENVIEEVLGRAHHTADAAGLRTLQGRLSGTEWDIAVTAAREGVTLARGKGLNQNLKGFDTASLQKRYRIIVDDLSKTWEQRRKEREFQNKERAEKGEPLLADIPKPVELAAAEDALALLGSRKFDRNAAKRVDQAADELFLAGQELTQRSPQFEGPVIKTPEEIAKLTDEELGRYGEHIERGVRTGELNPAELLPPLIKGATKQQRDLRATKIAEIEEAVAVGDTGAVLRAVIGRTPYEQALNFRRNAKAILDQAEKDLKKAKKAAKGAERKAKKLRKQASKREQRKLAKSEKPIKEERKAQERYDEAKKRLNELEVAEAELLEARKANPVYNRSGAVELVEVRKGEEWESIGVTGELEWAVRKEGATYGVYHLGERVAQLNHLDDALAAAEMPSLLKPPEATAAEIKAYEEAVAKGEVQVDPFIAEIVSVQERAAEWAKGQTGVRPKPRPDRRVDSHAEGGTRAAVRPKKPPKSQRQKVETKNGKRHFRYEEGGVVYEGTISRSRRGGTRREEGEATVQKAKKGHRRVDVQDLRNADGSIPEIIRRTENSYTDAVLIRRDGKWKSASYHKTRGAADKAKAGWANKIGTADVAIRPVTAKDVRYGGKAKESYQAPEYVATEAAPTKGKAIGKFETEEAAIAAIKQQKDLFFAKAREAGEIKPPPEAKPGAVIEPGGFIRLTERDIQQAEYGGSSTKGEWYEIVKVEQVDTWPGEHMTKAQRKLMKIPARNEYLHTETVVTVRTANGQALKVSLKNSHSVDVLQKGSQPKWAKEEAKQPTPKTEEAFSEAIAKEQAKLESAREGIKAARKKQRKRQRGRAKAKSERDPNYQEQLREAEKLTREIDGYETAVSLAERRLRSIKRIQKRTKARELKRRDKLGGRTWEIDRQEFFRALHRDAVLDWWQETRRGRLDPPGLQREPAYIPDIVSQPDSIFKDLLIKNVTNTGELARYRSTGRAARLGNRITQSDAVINAFMARFLGNNMATKIRRVGEELGLTPAEFLADHGINLPKDARRISKQEVVEIGKKLEGLVDPEAFIVLDQTRVQKAVSKGTQPEPTAEVRLRELARENIEEPIPQVRKDGTAGGIKDWLEEIQQSPGEWADISSYRIIERQVGRELAPGSPNSALNFLARTKSFASQLILGTNPQWLGFQVYANGFLLGIADPASFFGAPFSRRIDQMKGVDPGARLAYQRQLGLSPHLADYGNMQGGNVLSWQVYKRGLQDTQLWHKVRGRSIFGPMFRMDYRNNKFFKGTLLTSKVKREAFKRMDKGGGRIIALTDDIMARASRKAERERAEFGYKPTAQEYHAALDSVLKDRRLMNELRREVNAWMGDYQTFTAAERAWLSNNVMFYGFLRHSLTLATRTLPRAPIRANILAKMSQITLEDQMEILKRYARKGLLLQLQQMDVKNDLSTANEQQIADNIMKALEEDGKFDTIPIPMLGDFFFESPFNEDQLWMIQTSRSSALGNLLFESESPAQLINALNPFLLSIGEALTGYDYFTGKPLTTGRYVDEEGNKATPFGFSPIWASPEGTDTSAGQQVEKGVVNTIRHFSSTVLNMIAPYRGFSAGAADLPASERVYGALPGVAGLPIPGFERLFGEKAIKWSQDWRRIEGRARTKRFRDAKIGPMWSLAEQAVPMFPKDLDPVTALFYFGGDKLTSGGYLDDARQWLADGGYFSDKPLPGTSEEKDPTIDQILGGAYGTQDFEKEMYGGADSPLEIGGSTRYGTDILGRPKGKSKKTSAPKPGSLSDRGLKISSDYGVKARAAKGGSPKVYANSADVSKNPHYREDMMAAGYSWKRAVKGGEASHWAYGSPQSKRSADAILMSIGAKPFSGGLGTPQQQKSIRAKLKEQADKAVIIDAPLSAEQKQFAAHLARSSNMSPRLAAAAVLREGGNNTPGDNNWLNIGWTGSGPHAITRDPVWRNPETAAKATAAWIRGQFGQEYDYVAADGIQAIATQNDDNGIIQAWAQSGWAESGATPGDTYDLVQARTNPIDKKLVHKARWALGDKETKRVLGRAEEGKPVKAATPLPGRYSGSQNLIRSLIGSKVRGDHGGTPHGEAPGEHSAGGDHYDANSYAQDINQPTTDNREREPVYNQETLDAIVKRIKKAGYVGDDPTGLQIGENWTGQVDGYRVQLLTNEDGKVNHIHIGARWAPAVDTASGLSSGAPLPVPGGMGSAPTPSGGSGPSGQTPKPKRTRSYEGFLKMSGKMGEEKGAPPPWMPGGQGSTIEAPDTSPLSAGLEAVRTLRKRTLRR